jgi:hypothetical protein
MLASDDRRDGSEAECTIDFKTTCAAECQIREVAEVTTNQPRADPIQAISGDEETGRRPGADAESILADAAEPI